MMAKENKVTGQQVNNSLVLGGEAVEGVTFEQAFDIMMSDSANLESLSTEYFKFEKKAEYGFIVERIETAVINEKQVQIVKLRDKEGRQLINGDKVLVSACSRLKQLPSFIKVKYKGDIKNNTGTYKDLEVLTFKQPVE